MKPILRFSCVLFLTLVASACAERDTSAPARPEPAFIAPLSVADEGAVVARVDGVPIHAVWLAAIAKARNLDLNDPAQRTRAIEELVEYAVLFQAAQDTPDLMGDAERIEIELNAVAARANAIVARIGAVDDPDEATLRAEYDQQMALNGDQEYRVSHILFADEETAGQAAAAAQEDARDFAAVQSEFQDRAQQAKDWGWIKLGQVPAEFADALRALKPGETTMQPVQTAYGWHVIHLHETRPFTPPAFEQVREGIRRMIIAKATRSAIDGLKSKSQIEIVSP